MLASFSVARVVLIVVGGVWADRLPRRVVMLTADLVRTASQGFLAVVLITDTTEIWHLALAGAVAGGAAAFFNPASTGFVPDAVSAGRLQQANALISVSDSATGLFGPALSGVLVAAAGPGWVFRDRRGQLRRQRRFSAGDARHGEPAEQRQPFVREVIDGVREIAARSWLAASLVSFALENIMLASYYVLGPLVVSVSWAVRATGVWPSRAEPSAAWSAASSRSAGGRPGRYSSAISSC